MMRNAMILGTTGLALVVGGIVFSRQKAVSAAGEGRASPHASVRSGHQRAAKTDSVASLLERLAACRDVGGSFDREAFSALMASLLKLDVEAAAAFVESIPSGPIRSEALRRLAQALAALDPERAELWASGLPDEAERGFALGDVCSEIALTDAGEAVRMFERRQLDGASGLLLENLIQQWADQDYGAAAAWTLARPAGQQREQMCGRLAIVLAATEPEKAARLVLDEIPEGMNQTEAVLSVLYQWGARDREGASAWVALFPPGSLKDRAENELSQLGRQR